MNPLNPRALSRLGPRGTLGLAVLDLADRDGRVLGLTADLAITAGLERFRSKFPDRFFNVGIAEQNLVGVASGLAEDGWIPFAVSFANFSALRACEFVRHHLGYMKQNVKLVGIGAGFSMGQFGTSHYSLEDVAFLRAVPNLAIVSPSDCVEIVDAVNAAAHWTGPVYLRITGSPPMPQVDQQGTTFNIGKGRVLAEGEEVTIVATGSLVREALDAATLLRAQGREVGVVNMHTVKPIDRPLLLALTQKTKSVVTVEEHSSIGGLGSAVAELYSGIPGAPRLHIIGVPDAFPQVGSHRYVLEQCGLTGTEIARQTALLTGMSDAVLKGMERIGNTADRQESAYGKD